MTYNPRDLEKQKFTLIVDGNWFAISRWQSLCRDRKLTFQPEQFELDRRWFIERLSKSLFNEIEKLTPAIDEIIIATDYKSWRKEYTYLTHPEFSDIDPESADIYKENREYDEDVDFNALFGVFVEWMYLLKQFNIHRLQVTGAEGDDCLAIASSYLNEHLKNVLLFGSDKDLIQCNRINHKTGNFTTYYRKRAAGYRATYRIEDALMMSPATYEHMKHLATFTPTIDIFGDSANYLNKEQNPAKHILETMHSDIDFDNPASNIMYKILLGDGGDNVPHIIDKDSSTGKKGYFKVTHKHICEALDAINVTHDDLKVDDVYRDSFIEHMITGTYKALYRSKNNPDPELDEKRYDWYKKRWIENRHLVMLDAREIPEHVVSGVIDTCSMIIALHPDNRYLQKPESVDDILQLFDMIDSESAMHLYEQELLSGLAKAPSSNSDEKPIAQAKPTPNESGTTNINNDNDIDIDDIVNKAMYGDV